MNKLSLIDLIGCIEEAKKNRISYIGVKFKSYGLVKPEIIFSQIDDFDNKLNYYKKAYNYDLSLKGFNENMIVGFSSGNSFKEIQEKLHN